MTFWSNFSAPDRFRAFVASYECADCVLLGVSG